MDILVDLLKETEIAAILFIGAVKGIVEALKLAFIIDTRFLPLISIVVGVVFNVTLAIFLKLPIPNAFLLGVISGLGASGYYDNVQAGKKIGR